MDAKALVNLCHRIQKGDSDAYRQLYEACYLPIYRFAYGLTWSKEDAEDLTQEVFLKLATVIHSFKDGNVLAWMMTIARNLFYDSMRKRKKEWVLSDEIENIGAQDDSLDATIDGQEAQGKLKDTLASLSEHDRELLVLRYWQEYDMKQIAEIVGKSHAALRKEMSRIIKKVKVKLVLEEIE